MLDLNTATTMEIQMERDTSWALFELANRSYQDGLLSVNEFLDQGTPYQRRYEECVDRLIKDWAWGIKVAQQLYEV